MLLLHGGGDTPQTLHYLATALWERGYSIRVPLLPGHGRRLSDLARATADQWSAAAVQEYDALRSTHGQCFVVGFSLGGALAAQLAANAPALPALVLIAPYLAVPRAVAILARWAPLWGPVLPYLRVADAGSVLDPAERGQNRAFGILPARTFPQIRATAQRAAAALPRVMVPTLLMQSRNDNRISLDACRRAFAAIGAAEKRLELLDQGGHIVTVDYGRAVVIALTIEWIERHRRSIGAGASTAAP